MERKKKKENEGGREMGRELKRRKGEKEKKGEERKKQSEREKSIESPYIQKNNILLRKMEGEEKI